jgi:D-alanine transaminase
VQGATKGLFRRADNFIMTSALDIPPAPLPDTPCYLNGRYSPVSEAQVSVLDRGFIFGDGVYEVLPVYDGKIFRFEHHMARLQRSLDELRIARPMPNEEWLSIARRLIQSC